jgi:hypothetical protein
MNGDVREYRPGRIERLKERMERSTRFRIDVTTYTQDLSGRRYTFQSPAWLRTV